MPRPDSTSAFSAPAGAHLPVELLRRYVAGELPPAEEQQVEAHALDCAACADILEGLELQPAAAHDASVAALRQRLHTRVAELTAEAAPDTTVIPLWAWRPLAAAAVLLLSLGVVGWLAISRFNNSPDVAARPAAETTTRETEVPTTVRPTGAAVATAPEVAAVLPAAPASPLRQPVVTARTRRPVLVASAQVLADKPAELAGLEPGVDIAPVDASADASTQGTTAVEPAAAMLAAESAESKQAIAAAPEPVAAKAKMARMTTAPAAALAAPEAMRTIQGRVTDAAGVPLPGATVLVTGTQKGAVTNSDGSFLLTVPAATEQLSISSIGFKAQTRVLRPSDSTLALALTSDSKQLSEVVVRREAPPMLPSIAATPAGGYGKLRQYLADSLDYPEKALTDRREGTVRVQFVVGADGKLSDFKVVKSVSPECDEEALRLLKEGPNWFPAVENNRRLARKVVVNVPFKIER
ncbi:TonB family protein [Hymenobacter endophyticus]|uniref:TonB family protein n=1 Tax=Hymenobacter endophyticus TaxID=3076335 RepID=A0ABU3TFC5_9BACT|nr:TonB family protein [Hymenobacter endophyticus]MDU0369960.1 TonB family protein [Hymenobacter endophyticus]